MKKETKIPEAGSQQPKNKFLVFVQAIWSRIIPSSKKEATANQLNAKKPLIVLSNSGKLRVDENDANLFYSLEDDKFSIRVIKQKDKDQCIFATSVPHNFEEADVSLMKNTIPQLVKVQTFQTHEFLIAKSPAVKFSDIGEDILNFLFTYIYNLNHWAGEKVVFTVKKNLTCLEFSSIVPICRFKNLNKELGLIEGLVIEEDGDPFGFRKDKTIGLHYDFMLFYGRSFSWKDLRPKIEKVFRDYFKGGVEFEYHDY